MEVGLHRSLSRISHPELIQPPCSLVGKATPRPTRRLGSEVCIVCGSVCPRLDQRRSASALPYQRGCRTTGDCLFAGICELPHRLCACIIQSTERHSLQVDSTTVATLYQPSSSGAFKPRRRKVRPRATLLTVQQQQQSGDQDMLSMGNNDDDICGESLASVQQPSTTQPEIATVKTEPDEADNETSDTEEQQSIWCCTCSSTGILSVRPTIVALSLSLALTGSSPDLRSALSRAPLPGCGGLHGAHVPLRFTARRVRGRHPGRRKAGPSADCRCWQRSQQAASHCVSRSLLAEYLTRTQR